MSQAISLSDYEHLRTRMCFMDETGTLANPRDRFLGLGMVKAGHPCFATQEIQHLRDRHHFYDEVKWTKLSAKKLELFWTIAEMLWDNQGYFFHCLFVSKDDPALDLERRFGGDLWRAYEHLAVILMKTGTARNEVLSLLADKVVRPRSNHMEMEIKRRINSDFGRLAVQGVVSVDSKGVELVQMADLFLGAVAYDFKVTNGLIPATANVKHEFLQRLRDKVGVASLAQEFRTQHFRVQTYKPLGAT